MLTVTPSNPHPDVHSEVILIAMVAGNGVLGDGADQPWHLRDDQRRFKSITTGHPLVMGRKTFEAIGRPLPGRTTVVVTTDPEWAFPPPGSESTLRPGTSVLRAASLEDALRVAAAAEGGEEIWIAGGGTIYDQAIPFADRLELTEVDADADGTVHFPTVDPAVWHEVARDDRAAFAFVTYRRGSSAA